MLRNIETIIVESGRHTFRGDVGRIEILKGTVTIEDMTSGEVLFYNKSRGVIKDQKGGYCSFRDDSKGIVENQLGGNCYIKLESNARIIVR
jgi:hypothetical protein